MSIGRDPASIRRSVMTWRTNANESLQAMEDWVGSYRELGFDDFVLYWLGDPASDEVTNRFAAEGMPGLQGR